MQTTFGVNMLALVNGRPQTLLTLKQALRHFIDFRGEVIVRRATYDLAQAEQRPTFSKVLRSRSRTSMK